MYRDDKGRIIHNTGKLIGDVPVLIVEAVAIREALRTPSQLNMNNLLMKSDSQVVINSKIVSRSKTPCQIINLIANILRLAR